MTAVLLWTLAGIGILITYAAVVSGLWWVALRPRRKAERAAAAKLAAAKAGQQGRRRAP